MAIGKGYVWMMFEKNGLRFLMSKWDWVKYYDVDLINTIVAKVETKIESITLYSNNTFVI
jgi:hypothetical protein